jgi:hypothetical protein
MVFPKDFAYTSTLSATEVDKACSVNTNIRIPEKAWWRNRANASTSIRMCFLIFAALTSLHDIIASQRLETAFGIDSRGYWRLEFGFLIEIKRLKNKVGNFWEGRAPDLLTELEREVREERELG